MIFYLLIIFLLFFSHILNSHALFQFKARAYSIAHLYYEVGDYKSCQKYVEQFISQKSDHAAAYKLLGQAFHKLGEKEKALEQYKTSFDINPNQSSIILDSK